MTVQHGIGYGDTLNVVLKPLDTVIEIPCQRQRDDQHRAKRQVQFSTKACLPCCHFPTGTLIPSSIRPKDTKQNTSTIEWFIASTLHSTETDTLEAADYF